MELPKTITKTEMLTHENADELFCMIDEFIRNWIGEFILKDKKSYGVGYYDFELKKKELYKYLPTDKDKIDILEKMISHNIF